MVWDRPRNEKKMTLENKESQEQWLRSVGHSESANVNLSVKEIPSKDTYPFLLGIHYAQRIPSISHAFGLFRDEQLIGVCTYGTPPSAPLRKGVCGDDHKGKVLELNRLCLSDNGPNYASRLIARSLRMLPRPSIVVSFADTAQDHVGYVYQATNFLYCGLSAKRTDWKVKGKEHLHGQTVADEFRGVKNRAQAMREKYGDDFYLAPRPRKHRYICFLGSKAEKRDLLAALRYDIEDYPKATANKT